MAGDSKGGADVVGEDGRAGQRRVGRRARRVVAGDNGDGEIDEPDGGVAGRVGGGVAERIRTGIAGRRGVHVGAVGRHRYRAVGRRGVTDDGQAGARVVGQNRRCRQGGVGRCRADVVGGDRIDSENDRRRGALTGCIRGGIGEAASARVVGDRGVGVGAIGRHRDRAMRRCRVAGDGEPRTEVVDQHRRTVERDVGRRDAGVGGGNRSNGDVDGRR